MHGSLQQDGGGREGGGGAVDYRGRKKEQVRLERKDKKKRTENYLCCLLLSPHASTSTDSVYMHIAVKGLVSKTALLKFKVTLTESSIHII